MAARPFWLAPCSRVHVTVDWFSGSRHQFDLEYDRATGAVTIKQVSGIARTFLNGGGPTGVALPVDKRVAVASDAANAPYQVAGVPDDAPLGRAQPAQSQVALRLRGPAGAIGPDLAAVALQLHCWRHQLQEVSTHLCAPASPQGQCRHR